MYHGGTDIIERPEIRSPFLGRDFGKGFYCTDILTQAQKWARRQALIRKKTAILNVYEFDRGAVQRAAQNILSIKLFEDYSKDWLELICKCRMERFEPQP